MAGAEDDLRGVRLRITRPRIAVLTEVYAHPHADVDTIASAARARLGSVSTQAVYDVLRTLTEVGLVRRIEPAGSAARFEVQTDDNHHHLVCRACGAIVDVDCATGVAPCLQASDDAGYLVDEAEVTYWGLCPGCQSIHDASGLPPSAPHHHPITNPLSGATHEHTRIWIHSWPAEVGSADSAGR